MALQDFFNNKVLGELREGMHECTMSAYSLVSNTQTPYLRINFTMNDGNVYTRNFFERDLIIMVSHLRRQLGRQHETIVPSEFFKELIDSQTPLKFWIVYPTVMTKNGPRRVQNILFLEPEVTQQAQPEEPTAQHTPTGDEDLTEQFLN